MHKGRFSYEKLPKYPRLREHDRIIWERFIDNNPEYFNMVDYDAHCGYGCTKHDCDNDNIKRGFRHLTKKRIDVVGYNDNETTLIEVKPSAYLKSVGQILVYEYLYCNERTNPDKVNKMIITDYKKADMQRICNHFGVELRAV